MGITILDLGIVVARRRLASPWADHVWLAHAVLPAVPPVAPWTSLGQSAAEETFFAGPFAVELHPGVTAHYRDNLAAALPSVWISLRPEGERVAVAQVTLDPYEGEAMAEGVGESVEAVPMPAETRERLAAFVAEFHVERPFVKRQRDRVDPGSRGRRRPGGENG